MNPNEIGKKLGIGVRVAGRIAQQRAQESARAKAQTAAGMTQQSTPAASSQTPGYSQQMTPDYGQRGRELGKKSRSFSRAAGRGVGGFLRPFGRVGGILWLEVTGFFFGLFGLYFATDMWKTRMSYLAGPQHSRFLIAAGLTVLFAYLSASAFWRARRR